ncbi:MAG: hypothetical protein IKD69_01385 [Solobacterium sp.]|nr:hypothetical protein [Solobacterium sp.]
MKRKKAFLAAGLSAGLLCQPMLPVNAANKTTWITSTEYFETVVVDAYASSYAHSTVNGRNVWASLTVWGSYGGNVVLAFDLPERIGGRDISIYQNPSFNYFTYGQSTGSYNGSSVNSGLVVNRWY